MQIKVCVVIFLIFQTFAFSNQCDFYETKNYFYSYTSKKGSEVKFEASCNGLECNIYAVGDYGNKLDFGSVACEEFYSRNLTNKDEMYRYLKEIQQKTSKEQQQKAEEEKKLQEEYSQEIQKLKKEKEVQKEKDIAAAKNYKAPKFSQQRNNKKSGNTKYIYEYGAMNFLLECNSTECMLFSLKNPSMPSPKKRIFLADFQLLQLNNPKNMWNYMARQNILENY